MNNINGIAIVSVIGRIKNPKKLKLLNTKSKNELILFFNSSGNAGMFIQPNNNLHNKNNKSHKKFNKFPSLTIF